MRFGATRHDAQSTLGKRFSQGFGIGNDLFLVVFKARLKRFCSRRDDRALLGHSHRYEDGRGGLQALEGILGDEAMPVRKDQ